MGGLVKMGRFSLSWGRVLCRGEFLFSVVSFAEVAQSLSLVVGVGGGKMEGEDLCTNAGRRKIKGKGLGVVCSQPFCVGRRSLIDYCFEIAGRLRRWQWCFNC
jgi:hypothetical protein